MTLTVFLNEREDGTWFASCPQHAAWRCSAETYRELMVKATKSLKTHHSRNLQFTYWINGTVST